MTDVLAGAEAWSAEGGPVGVLVLHGFTGNPSSMRELAEAFAAQGHAVELPRLPGHGTRVEDMIDLRWEDWTAAAEAALDSLEARCDIPFVVGLSMGGALTTWLGAHRAEVAGLVCVNPMAGDYGEVRDAMAAFVEAGEVRVPGIGSDIKRSGVVESAYTDTPLAALVSLLDGCTTTAAELGRITAPLLLFTSPEDHVVPAEASDILARSVSGPVERVTCADSYHVATQDNDKDMIVERSLEFVARVAGSR